MAKTQKINCKRKKIILSLEQKAEWMSFFEKQKSIISPLKQDIAIIDQEIDHIVYTLYGLSSDEIAVVEGKEGA